MDKFARYNPGKDVSVAKKFTNTFGTEKYAQMLTAAKENPATKVAATKLQDDLLNQLLHKVESPDKVEGLLGLGKHGQNLAGHVNVEAFNSYSTRKASTLCTPSRTRGRPRS
ncbi:RxLR effector protein [Phytophthora megakarya]|uniref:RxLR effector protein n=1 Tax=Phytophthora megakarya TaxID=4795 RepID=A0A225W153_9STRA|nr:RxLR effector protein [Phytophthora megakarya]